MALRKVRALWARAASYLGRGRRERELDEELASHVEMHVADGVRAGLGPEEARRQALLRLGGVEQTKEAYRARQGLPALETLLQDVRLAVRKLRHSPGFTAATLTVLALGIGANTVMFSVVNTLLLRPLPYAEPERLLRVQTVDTASQEDSATAVPDFQEYRERNRTFEGLASFHVRSRDLTGAGDPERIRTLIVSAEFLDVLRTRPALGRGFAAEDERWGSHRSVILTDGLWRRRFGGDPALVGRGITLNTEPYTVIGVLPPRFAFMGYEFGALVPMSFAPGDNQNSHNNYFLTMVGRLRADASAAAALGDLNAISQDIVRRHPENKGTAMGVRPLQEALVGRVTPALFVLFGAVAFVLLITCANLANLMLSRVGVRRREVALRMAIGATRGRLLRQLLTESVLLSLAGSALALALTAALLGALNSLDNAVLPRLQDVRIDAAVLAFTGVVAVLTGILFGLVPALRSVDLDLASSLKDGTRSSGDATGHRLQATLVVSEVALSLVLLAGAGLMFRTMHGLLSVEPGFDAQGVLTVQASAPRQRYVDEALERRFDNRAYARAAEFFSQVIERTRAAPGVRSVGAINGLPLMGEIWDKNVTLYDRPLPATLRELPVIQYRVVAGDYFRALGIPVVAGRAFTDADTDAAEKVAIVNREMARRHWGDRDPVGKVISVNPPIQLVPAGTVTPDYKPTLFTIVGVAADAHYGALHQRPAPLVYIPYSQGSEGETTMYLVVRGAGHPERLAPAVRDALRQVDPDVPASQVRTMADRVSAAVATPRLQTALLGAFAGLALLLAAVGIYGVMSDAARRRTREVGIRMALGASTRAILGLFLRHGVRLVAAGVAAGLLAAFALTRAMQTLLFEVSPTDARVFGAVTLALSAVALAAAWVPARRATRLQPTVALRSD
jgi:putative ABC transport system permease protein